MLNNLEYEHSIQEIETTHGEQTMLGADETGRRLSVTDPVSFDVDVISATVDPVTKFMLSFFITDKRQEEMTENLCVVTISDVTDETRIAIARFMTQVMAISNRPPWKLTHHVGLRLAVLLRFKVRVLWTYWQRVAETKMVGEQ